MPPHPGPLLQRRRGRGVGHGLSMLRNNPDYRRLKVDGYGALGSASYWLGRDHLLVVATSNYVENYYRFLYADIQAVIIRRNPLRLIWGSVFSVLMIGSLLGAMAVKVDAPSGNLPTASLYGMGGLLGLALMFAALQTLNLLRGPTCACHLRTAVQVMPLPHLTRWRKAERLVAELTPLALAVQPPVAAPAPATETLEPAPQPAAGATPEAQSSAPEDPNLPPRIGP